MLSDNHKPAFLKASNLGFKLKLNTDDSPFPKSHAATSGVMITSSTFSTQETVGNCCAAASFLVGIDNNFFNQHGTFLLLILSLYIAENLLDSEIKH